MEGGARSPDVKRLVSDILDMFRLAEALAMYSSDLRGAVPSILVLGGGARRTWIRIALTNVETAEELANMYMDKLRSVKRGLQQLMASHGDADA